MILLHTLDVIDSDILMELMKSMSGLLKLFLRTIAWIEALRYLHVMRDETKYHFQAFWIECFLYAGTYEILCLNVIDPPETLLKPLNLIFFAEELLGRDNISVVSLCSMDFDSHVDPLMKSTDQKKLALRTMIERLSLSLFVLKRNLMRKGFSPL